jgi:dihydroneopterin aldolase
MSFYGYHGVSAAEKETGRRYEVDCELFLDLSSAMKSDKLQDTVNYAEVYQSVEHVLKNKRFSLIESIAGDICGELLQDARIKKVVVRVRKKMPPIPGNLDHVEVEIEQSRG